MAAAGGGSGPPAETPAAAAAAAAAAAVAAEAGAVLQREPLYNWQATKGSLRERFAFLFSNELLSDVHFVVGKGSPRGGSGGAPPGPGQQRIPAHRFVLAAGSAVFDAMFNGGMATTSAEIELPDVEPAAFLALLRSGRGGAGGPGPAGGHGPGASRSGVGRERSLLRPGRGLRSAAGVIASLRRPSWLLSPKSRRLRVVGVDAERTPHHLVSWHARSSRPPTPITFWFLLALFLHPFPKGSAPILGQLIVQSVL